MQCKPTRASQKIQRIAHVQPPKQNADYRYLLVIGGRVKDVRGKLLGVFLGSVGGHVKKLFG